MTDLKALAATLRAEGRVAEFLGLLADSAPRVFNRTERCAGNVYRRPMDFPKAGDRVVGHVHNYDHVTYVIRGSVVARSWEEVHAPWKDVCPECLRELSDGTAPPDDCECGWTQPSTERRDFREGTFRAPCAITVRASRFHEFVALEDGTLADCIFAHRDYTGEVVDAYMGNIGATQ